MEALLCSIDRSEPHGLRDFTLLYLAAAYGLRSSELVRLTLDDIDWRGCSLMLAGTKNRHAIRLPMTDETATPESSSRRRVLTGSVAFLLTGILIASAYFLWSSGVASSILKSAEPKMPVAEVTQGDVTVSILSADGQIHAKNNALQIKFEDPGGHPSLQGT